MGSRYVSATANAKRHHRAKTRKLGSRRLWPALPEAKPQSIEGIDDPLNLQGIVLPSQIAKKPLSLE